MDHRFVPAPSLWGVSYLTWDEIVATNPERFERYERARAQVGAGAAFLHMKETVVWVDPAAADPGIPSWRLYRTFGPRWRRRLAVYLLVAVAMLSKLVWRKPRIAR